MQNVQKQYGVTNNLTELEIPWTRGKRSADGMMCVMLQPDERTTGSFVSLDIFVRLHHSLMFLVVLYEGTPISVVIITFTLSTSWCFNARLFLYE